MNTLIRKPHLNTQFDLKLQLIYNGENDQKIYLCEFCRVILFIVETKI